MFAPSSNGPPMASAAVMAQLVAVARRNPSGGRRPRRVSSPYADAWTIAPPNSALATITVLTIPSSTSRSDSPSSAPAIQAITPAAMLRGTIDRTTVRLVVEATARAIAATAQPLQAPASDTMRTGVDRPVSADEIAAPPSAATPTQTARASQTSQRAVETGDVGVGTSSRFADATRNGPTYSSAGFGIRRSELARPGCVENDQRGEP